MNVRLGTRGSALARWQAQHVQQQLFGLGWSAEIVILSTTGDRRTDVSLAALGGKGLFVGELELALRAGEIDLAVHSLKDVPSALPLDMRLAAVLERGDARDALVAAPGTGFASLPHGARLATGSLRRQAQALALRPDLQVLPLRGNVDTRLRRWREGYCDALLLAAAGLERLGLAGDIADRLSTDVFIPCGGQGALAVECRADNAAMLALGARLNHVPTALATAAERALLRRLDCGCQSPVAAHACWRGDDAANLHLAALVALPDGRRRVQAAGSAAVDDEADALALGDAVGRDLLAQGAEEMLRQCR